MFQLGKKNPRPRLTPEQKDAFARLRQFCQESGITKDEIAQMFGCASWNSLNACNTSGKRAEAIVNNLPKFKRWALNTSKAFS